MAESTDNRDALFVAQLTQIQLALLQYVRAIMPGDTSVQDVAQQSNARIWEKRAEFEPNTNFKAWAFSIARYEVLNHRKRQARDNRLSFTTELEKTFAEELAGQSEEVRQRHEALKVCLQKLRAVDRDLLLHRYASDRSLNEFAESAGRSVGGLKVTLHRLRSALLACIERTLSSGEATA